jgi:hypothetical protein
MTVPGMSFREILSSLEIGSTHVVAFLNSSPCTEAQADPRWPCSTLEKKNGKYDAKGETETRSDEEGGDAAIPLHLQMTLADGWRLCVRLNRRENESGPDQAKIS